MNITLFRLYRELHDNLPLFDGEVAVVERPEKKTVYTVKLKDVRISIREIRIKDNVYAEF